MDIASPSIAVTVTHIFPQEKRRRKAGQRHWEQWVSRKAQSCKRDRRATDEDTAAGHVGEGGDRPCGIDLGARRRKQEEAEVERRKKMQDEAFAAWVREKDKLFRSRKKEVRSRFRQESAYHVLVPTVLELSKVDIMSLASVRVVPSLPLVCQWLGRQFSVRFSTFFVVGTPC